MNKSAKSDGERALLFHLKVAGVPAPLAEFRFHPTRKWRFDFAWTDEKVALEVEGGIWVGGRHNSPVGFQKDMEKYNEAAIAGWCVLRATTKEVLDGSVVKTLQRALENRGRG